MKLMLKFLMLINVRSINGSTSFPFCQCELYYQSTLVVQPNIQKNMSEHDGFKPTTENKGKESKTLLYA
ncbi:hypothetical protein GQ457_14G026410 [Hibiscus cannabinus]